MRVMHNPARVECGSLDVTSRSGGLVLECQLDVLILWVCTYTAFVASWCFIFVLVHLYASLVAPSLTHCI